MDVDRFEIFESLFYSVVLRKLSKFYMIDDSLFFRFYQIWEYQEKARKWQCVLDLGDHGSVVHDVSWSPNLGRFAFFCSQARYFWFTKLLRDMRHFGILHQFWHQSSEPTTWLPQLAKMDWFAYSKSNLNQSMPPFASFLSAIT
jgi:hypothetical protein